MPLVATSGELVAQDQYSFRSGVYLTRIKVSVLDDEGEPVTGLATNDFKLFEDGVEQDIQLVLAPSDAPLDLALVLDFSASIEQEWPDPRPREAIHALLDALEPDDCVLLIPFHAAVGPGRWGPPGAALLRRIVDSIPYGSETRLYDAIQAAYRGLQWRGHRRQASSHLPDEDAGIDAADTVCGEPLRASEANRRRAASDGWTFGSGRRAPGATLNTTSASESTTSTISTPWKLPRQRQ